jgi:hypothetical protein
VAASDALSPRGPELPLARAKRAESRIICMQLRREHDALHESRAWSPCRMKYGRTDKLRLCRCQQEETGNACGVVEPNRGR